MQYSRASNTETAVKILNEARAHRVQADVFDVTSGDLSAARRACGRAVSAAAAAALSGGAEGSGRLLDRDESVFPDIRRTTPIW